MIDTSYTLETKSSTGKPLRRVSVVSLNSDATHARMKSSLYLPEHVSAHMPTLRDQCGHSLKAHGAEVTTTIYVVHGAGTIYSTSSMEGPVRSYRTISFLLSDE